MSKWKETNKYGIHESKAAYWRYTRRMDKEAEILKELEPNPPTHVDLTGFEDYIQRLREPKEPTRRPNIVQRGINRNFNKYWNDYYSHPRTYEYHPTLETICERNR